MTHERLAEPLHLACAVCGRRASFTEEAEIHTAGWRGVGTGFVCGSECAKSYNEDVTSEAALDAAGVLH